jgi:hypothetical protein
MSILEPMILLQDERSRWMRYVMRIYALYTSEARYELKGYPTIWRVNVKVIGDFTNIPLADFFMDKTAP